MISVLEKKVDQLIELSRLLHENNDNLKLQLQLLERQYVDMEARIQQSAERLQKLISQLPK